jgi:hypothetical protein
MPPKIQARRPAFAGPEARAIETWLPRHLATLYDTTLMSSVPSELMELAQHFDA